MPSSPVAEARSLRSRIQDDLAHHIVNPDSIGDAYIRASDVVRAWSGHGTIERALYPAVLNGAEVEFIRNHLLTFLSILVYIDAHDFLRDFRANVFDVFDDNGSLRYADSKLPLVEKDVPALGKFHLRKRFLDDQYLFIPEVLVESATVKQISDQRRLPFESVSKDVFAGAYGKIDKVGISPSYFRTQDGATFSEIKYVASKRFHAQLPSSYTDPKRELDNLKVLKESITLHRNIRLHLAIILHKSEHLILLPWAEHLDLEIFLNEGRDFRGQEIYDFKRRFRSIQPGMMIKDICRQMHHVADALRWLHEGTITHGTRNRIRFAHMDLKPNNILIDNDNGTSAVGTWVLTDFGISAFKEDGDTADNLVSVRDYYENLTINTPPRRDAGAYQPPEVGQTNMKSSERRNGPREGSVGRRGDIWSFACIFAEVLAFSQGQAALLKEFRKVRKGRHRNDYFYEIDDDTLQPDGSKMSYRVRPQILDWLWALPDKYVFPKRAIDCCVETIQRVLVVDGSRRPKADELLKMFNHVENHVDLARAPGGFPPHCPLLHPTSIPSPLVVQHPIAKEPPLTPPIHIKRTNTIEEESLFTHQDWPSPPVGRSQSDSNPPPDANEPLQSPRHLPPGQLTPFRDREDSLLDPSNSSPPPPKSPTGLGIYNESARTSSITEVAQLSILSRQNSRESRRGLHGVMINQDKGRRMGAVTESIAHLTCSKKDIVSFNLCPSGRRVAYLTKAEESHYGIQLFDILSENSQVKKTVRFWPVSNPIALPTGTKWKHVVVADDNTVAWGKSGDGTGSKQQVYITNPMGSRLFNGSEFKGLSTLTAVAISQRGSLAFVSNKSILYTVIEGELVDLNGSPFREFIPSKSDHSFTHAAFNDDGSLLYAWEYGRPDDRLSVWRIEESDRKLVLPIDSEGSYPSKQQGTGVATLIPYNTYHGCIIHAENDAFFPAQIRSTQRGSKLTLEKKIVSIPKVVGACTYGDHSLLVTEKGMLKTRVWEHRIAGGAIHVIEQTRKPLIEINCRAGDEVHMRVVAVPNSDDLMIVLCMANGRVYMVPVERSLS